MEPTVTVFAVTPGVGVAETLQEAVELAYQTNPDLRAQQAQLRAGGYYWWRGGCYYRYPNGSWLQVQPGYCS